MNRVAAEEAHGSCLKGRRCCSGLRPAYDHKSLILPWAQPRVL
jgi:hypothetical protein